MKVCPEARAGTAARFESLDLLCPNTNVLLRCKMYKL